MTFPSLTCTPASIEPNLGENPSIKRQRKSYVEEAKLPGLWEYMRNELKSIDVDESHIIKSERVANFLSVPYQLEKLLLFGFCICLDSFLYTFTILPIRILIALWHSVLLFFTLGKWPRPLKPAERCDLLKGALILICSYLLLYIDASRLYHSVRGQSVVKLYVIFNVLEVGCYAIKSLWLLLIQIKTDL